MKNSEIQMFKQFLSDKNISQVFADTYKKINRNRGLDVKFRAGSSSLQFTNIDLAKRLVELLDLNPEQEYFHLGIELLDETKDYLLFILKK